MNEAEGQLGCKLIERDGARGSTLTPAGERAIAVYEELQADINNVIAAKPTPSSPTSTRSSPFGRFLAHSASG